MIKLGQLGEREVIRRLTSYLGEADNVKVGAGDDAAVVSQDDAWDWVLTSDAVLEGTHFDTDTPAEAIGHKLMGRALSDIAAMGARPQWALIDVEAPGSCDVSRLEAVYQGATKLSRQHGLTIVGGDVASSNALGLHVFAVGCVPSDSAVLRSAAEAGDLVYVTGALGGSIHGKHLSFDPRVKEGQWLREHGFARAMIDLSDGLATDLHHVAEGSAIAMEIELSKIPVSETLAHVADPLEKVDRALRDGEDYELLFTMSADRCAEFDEAWAAAFDLACTQIGTVVEGRGVTSIDAEGRRSPLESSGYQHFT